MGAAPTPGVSLPAAILALASAAIGSVVYLLLYPGEPLDLQAWGYALGWGVPLTIVALAYLGRRLDPRLAAGIFGGAGMAQFFGWLPSVLVVVGASAGVWGWVSIVSGLLAITAGVVAAVSGPPGARPPVRVGAPGAATTAGAEPAGEPPPPPPAPRFPWTPSGGPTTPCLSCGHPLDPRAELCPACGSRQEPAAELELPG